MATTAKTTKTVKTTAPTTARVPSTKTTEPVNATTTVSTPPAVTTDPRVDLLTAQVETLLGEVENLQNMLNVLRDTPTVTPAPAAGSAAEVAKLRSDLRTVLRKMGARDHMVNSL